MRFGFVLEYEGSNFHGSQFQPNCRTVQGEFEKAVAKVFGQDVRAVFASRTDTGAHAVGQVACADIESARRESEVTTALNFFLPSDLKVRRFCEAPEGFEPRRHAVRRTYLYRISNSALPTTLQRNTHAQIYSELDAEAMNAASSMLLGKHNFEFFAGNRTAKTDPKIRRIYNAEITRKGTLINFIVSANAFLHRQVRNMAAALVSVGAGKINLIEFQAMIENGKELKKHSGIKPLPAHGLCLLSIQYADCAHFTLPAPDGLI